MPVISVGTHIELRGRDEHDRPLPQSGKRIVVAMSDCGSCARFALDLKRLRGLKLGIPMILVYPDRKTLDATLPLGIRALDGQPSFLPSVMRAFRPHAAVIDAQGNVIAAALGGPEILNLLQGESI